MKSEKVRPSYHRVLDRVLKEAVPGIATAEDRFALENGFYVNEDETVIIQSTNETGKFFKKIEDKF